MWIYRDYELNMKFKLNMKKMLILLCHFGLLLNSGNAAISHDVEPHCAPTDEICEFEFVVDRRQTMMYYEGILGTPIVSRDGVLYKHPKCDSDDTNVVASAEDLSTVITTDGTSHRYVHTINGEYPGPPVVVYHGQEVVVKVVNHLWQEGLGIHWHGIIHPETNWMDGAPGVTQCPINPHETFTYRFIADPVGTHWYHPHFGSQRTEGAFGAFIVLPKPGHEPEPDIPEYEHEYIMVVHDFFPQSSNLGFVSFMNNLKQFLWDGYNKTGQCYSGGGKAVDGASTATYGFYSTLFNGLGQRLDENEQPYINTPLERYTVKPNKFYNFRVINAGGTFALRISVDQHPMIVTSSDGNELVPVRADVVILNPGERFDFYIKTNQTVGKYWIRAETFETTPHLALAVMEYEGSQGENPNSVSHCKDKSCTVINCPFKQFGIHDDDVCLNFEDLKSRNMEIDQDGKLDEYIMGIAKTRIPQKQKKRNTARGIQFTPPSAPPVIVGSDKYDHDCDKLDCENQPCQCTQVLKTKLGDMVQLVMASNTTHPMHLHSNPFQVIKIGYPEYGADNFVTGGMNKDVVCNNEFCNNAWWKNKEWENGNIPGANLVNPPIKDTITIPAGGYVVIRFKAQYPGWWLFHCHIETHFLQGMAFIIKTGEDHEMIPPPEGFATCGSHSLGHDEFVSARQKRRSDVLEEEDQWSDREKKLAYGYVGAVILGLVVGIVVHVIWVKCRED